MAKTYLNGNDVNMKLHGTVIFYDRTPYYCRWGVEPGWEWQNVCLTPLTRQKGMKDLKVRHDDPKIEYSEYNLGYVNYGGEAHYIVRNADRVNHAAIRTTVLQSHGSHCRISDFFTGPEMEHMLLNKYPSFSVSLEKVKTGEVERMAFHRYFAIGDMGRGKLGLYYRGNLVGQYNNGTPTILPSNDASFIRFYLDKHELLKS